MEKDCFFINTPEAKRKVKHLKEEYEFVEVETVKIKTSHEELVWIAVVYYDKPKDSELFSDEEWEAICKSTGTQ